MSQGRTYVTADIHGDPGFISKAPADCAAIIIAGDIGANRPQITTSKSLLAIVSQFYGMTSKTGATGNGFSSPEQAEGRLRFALTQICRSEFRNISDLVDIATVRGEGPFPAPVTSATYFSYLASQSPLLAKWFQDQSTRDNTALLDQIGKLWGDTPVVLVKGNGDYRSILGYTVGSPNEWDREIPADFDPILDPLWEKVQALGWTIVDEEPLYLPSIDATLLGEGWFRWAQQLLDASTNADDRILAKVRIVESTPLASKLITHYPPLFGDEWYEDPSHSSDKPNQLTRAFGKIVNLVLNTRGRGFSQHICGHLHAPVDQVETRYGAEVNILGRGSLFKI